MGPAWLLHGVAAWGGDDPGTAIEDQTLDQLLDLFDDQMDTPTSVADREARSQREASALVTVFTGDELRRLGARDLVDALRLIPGIEFGVDVWNVDLMTTRGVSSEGRVLLLVDGHEMTEAVYGAVPWSHRIPATVIERVEVIRGPGSAVYGGYAMLTVIRVHTRAPTLTGVQADARASVLPSGAYGRQDLSLSAGAALSSVSRLGVSAVLGRGRRSDAAYTDLGGRSADLTPVSDLDPALISAALEVGRFDVALLAESFGVVWQDGGERIPARDRDARFSGLYGRASWAAPLGEAADLDLRVDSLWQEPWRNTRNARPGTYNHFRTRVHRTTLAGEIDLHPTERIDLTSGAEVGLQGARSYPGQVQSWDPDILWLLGAGWAEVHAETAPVHLTVGTRYDLNTAYGQALSPRVVLARAWRRVHYKLGVSRAFRAPGVAQASPSVVPETTTAVDAEAGLGPTSWSYVTVSGFTNRLVDPMVYRYEYDPETGTEFEGYVNGDPMHTAGGDIELQLLSGPLRAAVGAGTVAVVETAPVDWRVPDDPHRSMGVPAFKAVARATWAPTGQWSVGGVATHVGPRWAIVDRAGTDGPAVFDRIGPTLLLDLAAEVHHVGLRGLSVGVSVHDLLDQRPPLVQPYRGFHAPMPAGGREALLRVTVER